MPRVVQVETHCDLNVNIRSGDHQDNERAESGREDELNTNYNQTEQIGDMHPSMLRFPINYELYNVTYSPSEDDVYCLTCNVGGKTVKYKKDARVWLHKNGDRKRKHDAQQYEGEQKGPITLKNTKLSGEEQSQNKEAIPDNFLESEQRRLMRIQEYFQNVCTRYDKYRTSGVYIDSDLESLGESEADLTYSEETTPSASHSNACCQEPPTSIDGNVDKHEVGRKDAQVQLVGSYKSAAENQLYEETDTLANASGNNNQARTRYYELARRIAPAIHMENESLAESLLDTAAFSADCVAANTRLQTRNKSYRQDVMGVMHTRGRNKPGFRRQYDPALRYRTQARGGVTKKKQPGKSQKKISAKHELSIRDCEPSKEDDSFPSHTLTMHPASISHTDHRELTTSPRSTASRACSSNAVPGPSCTTVPSLFLLASQAAHKYFSTSLDAQLVNKLL